MRVAIDGPALRRVREWQGRTVADLASAVGLTTSGLAHVEVGRRQSVSDAVFRELVAELDIVERPDWIVPRPSGIPTPRSSTESGLSSGITPGIIAASRPGKRAA